MYIFDLHQDISDSMLYTAHGDFWKRSDLHEGWNNYKNIPVNNQSDYPRLQEANVRAIFAACCAIHITPEGNVLPCEDHFSEVKEHIDLYHRLVDESNGKVRFILNKKDIDAVPDTSLNFLLAIEGADSIDEDLKNLEYFAERGVRSIGFTWNYTNNLAGGCMENGGLSPLGKRAIKKMEELGIVLDLAHINENSFWDCIEVSTKPVIISHTGCRFCFETTRNTSDEQKRAVKETGGTIGIFGVPKYLGEPTMEKVIEHIEHSVEVAGIDHVSLGTDFGSMTAIKLIPNFEQVTDIPNLITQLEKRGWSNSDLEKLCYKNIERVLRETLPE